MDLLCHVSTFFRAALEGGFEEAKEKRVTLTEEDPSAFKLFVLWLYKGCLFEYTKASTLNAFTVQAWVMGDKLGAPAFQNCIMEEILADGHDLIHDPEVIRYIYDNTAKGSPLRKVTVDMTVYAYEDIDQGKAWKSLYYAGGDFMVDLMKALQQHWRPTKDCPVDSAGRYILKF